MQYCPGRALPVHVQGVGTLSSARPSASGRMWCCLSVCQCACAAHCTACPWAQYCIVRASACCAACAACVLCASAASCACCAACARVLASVCQCCMLYCICPCASAAVQDSHCRLCAEPLVALLCSLSCCTQMHDACSAFGLHSPCRGVHTHISSAVHAVQVMRLPRARPLARYQKGISNGPCGCMCMRVYPR
jgi:hypothetical protein